MMITVLLVTTWQQGCGIAEHSAMLKEAVEGADPEIRIVPCPEALDPQMTSKWSMNGTDRVVHLNYQASLHSRWTPDEIRRLQRGNRKVLVTYHDTGVPNSSQCLGILRAADAGIVHEPCPDIVGDPALGPKVKYWRMGVPGPESPYRFGKRSALALELLANINPGAPMNFKSWHDQPVLGSIGFPFPWKHYDKLAEVTVAAGWALLLIAPTATDEQVKLWASINPDIYVRTDFVPRREAISLLAGCDATAFTYVTHNTGQSAAILQGIAARKPVIALKTCRQFRALYGDPLGKAAIQWCETFEDVVAALASCPIQRIDPGIVALAEQDSWTKLGRKYAALYQGLV